jgi:nitrogen fixation NifU-like protein
MRGVNPSCGDDINLSVNIKDNIINQVAFTGEGCAISQASTSIMADIMEGKTVDEARRLIKKFIGMIKKDVTDEKDLEELGDAAAFENISNMPARVKCAVLSWHTLEEAFNKTKS